MRTLRRLLEIDPPVLPMDTQEKLLRAIDKGLQEGGRNGGARCENAVYDFKRAVQYWHNVVGIPAVEHNLESAYAKQLLLGARKLALPPVPKNARYISNAEHGHLAFPTEFFIRCLVKADEKLAATSLDPTYRLGLQRDVTILLFLFPLVRRYEEAQHLIHSNVIDLGVGRGLDIVILHMKNRQRQRCVIPVPEGSACCPDLANRIRRFLAIAPTDGYLFRATVNCTGKHGQTWEPPMKPHLTTTNDIPSWSWALATYTSGQWNQAFQALLAEAVPGLDVRLYTAHSLRSGGLTAAANASLPLHRVSKMAEHASMDTTRLYLRNREQDRSNYTYIGAAESSAIN